MSIFYVLSKASDEAIASEISKGGLSDLACHYLSKAGVNAIRRLRKAANNRIVKACGAVVVNRPDGLQESDVCTKAGIFEVKKIRDEFFAFINECTDPKAYTVLLRGASKVHLNGVERNLLDAMSMARNIIKIPKLVPGGAATGLTASATLKQKSSYVEGIELNANGKLDCPCKIKAGYPHQIVSIVAAQNLSSSQIKQSESKYTENNNSDASSVKSPINGPSEHLKTAVSPKNESIIVIDTSKFLNEEDFEGKDETSSSNQVQIEDENWETRFPNTDAGIW
ncbi:T-complex protein 1 subunit gamma-like [Vitis riparia]|uniref:T-complex protein 1 subunit gamma-like n=1 Tax=Vitis riparia TaxID=96939 RepID=UPI00155AF284|nr:T-complex protein 1 subunit gamma-like [Vitis riparia]